ncbi:MAG: hypothetical protein ACHP9Z_24910, partial [Streptosporangiales bacterium]
SGPRGTGHGHDEEQPGWQADPETALLTGLAEENARLERSRAGHQPDRGPGHPFHQPHSVAAAQQQAGMTGLAVIERPGPLPEVIGDPTLLAMLWLTPIPALASALALCKRIAEQHGGEMYLDTSHTGGTRICFTLPPTPAADPAGGAAADRAAEPAWDGADPAARPGWT